MSEGRDSCIWLNGALLPARLARIDPSDRGLALGDGLFETIRVAGGVPQQVRHHLARLRRGAEQLGIIPPFDDAEILAAFTQTLAANALNDAVLRLTLTRGVGPRGVAPPADARPTLLITAAAWVAPSHALSAIICQSTRRNEFSPLVAIKSLNYLDNIIARREALRRGAEDAILLNTQGHVAEATAANLFLLKNGKWLTPPVTDGALPGVFRARALAGNAACEARISPDDLRAAEGLCFGNALSVLCVSRLDGQEIQTDPAAITELRAILDAKD
jgi:branched-chain amino acid aminotransferase